MAFDVTKPTDVVKIRNISTEIRPNFTAIQDGDLSFHQERVNIPVAMDGAPSTSGTMVRVYAKNDGSFIELWCKDTQGKQVQLTQNGSVGAITMYTNSLGISFDGVFSYDGTVFCPARGSVNSVGTPSNAIGVDTVSVLGTGQYRINISADQLENDSYQVVATAVSNSTTNNYVAVVASKGVPAPAATTAIDIYIWNITTGALADRSFEFIVMGGR